MPGIAPLAEDPEVRGAHRLLERCLSRLSDPDTRLCLNRALDALHTDPTLALEDQYTLDLMAAQVRQLPSLTRQAEATREKARLHTDPTLAETEREQRINRLGKINPAALVEERHSLERLRQLSERLAGRLQEEDFMWATTDESGASR